MKFLNRVHDLFAEHQKVSKLSEGELATKIVAASNAFIACYKNGNKVLSCGNGGSACDAEHFVAEMVNRFQIERANLPAISLGVSGSTLTAIANDYSYDEVFAKQVFAFATPGDILLAISTSGNSKSILRAIEAAHTQKIQVVAFTGKGGGAIGKLLKQDDIELRVPSDATPRIQEMHTLLVHIICDLIEQQLFGG